MLDDFNFKICGLANKDPRRSWSLKAQVETEGPSAVLTAEVHVDSADVLEDEDEEEGTFSTNFDAKNATVD